MSSPAATIAEFVAFAGRLQGDEKGEAQIFCDRLFRAFGHPGILEAGGQLEFRVHQGKGTKFADLLWRPRLLLEMKRRGEKLHKHYRQAFEYWLHLVPQRPEFVVLCNFDEFWVYNLNYQLDEPMDRVALTDLPRRYPALNFLFPEAKKPLFHNDRVAVTRGAADKVAGLFNQLVGRKTKPVGRAKAQRFILQCVIALFAEDIELLPRGLFSELLHDCKGKASSYDLLGGLFRQMANPAPADGGRFQDVPHFNGGLFAVVEPIELSVLETTLLAEAAAEDWAKVNPAVFGTLFEGSMDRRERHAFGAHFTSEADIQKVVLPTVVRPWRERLAAAKSSKDLLALREALTRYRVLDPACGSGNFLYVAYRELKRIETDLLDRLEEALGKRAEQYTGGGSLVRPAQFFGLDIKPFAVELAKVTLALAKKLALDEAQAHAAAGDHLFWHLTDPALPLENLDANVRCDDALFCDWPKADAIIGNPPYLDARKITMIHGLEYSARLRKSYPDVPGRADLCVHWFRRAHDELPIRGRAGLVGTNSVRQNYSREGGLDYIVKNGGTITEAISSQPWSGEASVHVSIVNWVKGDQPGPKKIYTQYGNRTDSPWIVAEVDLIPASLTAECDVTGAVHIHANRKPKTCLEGQQPGHKAFCIDAAKVREIAATDPDWQKIVKPLLNGDDLISGAYETNPSWIIDLGDCDIFVAQGHTVVFRHLQAFVLPDWTQNAGKEKGQTGKTTGEHQNRLQHWWLLKRRRPELVAAIERLSRYIVCSAVTKRPIFEFISSTVRPSNALKAFLFEDDYSFGILQSGIHWAWFTARCSTLTERFRYTPDTVFDTFPWPQAPTPAQAQSVAAAAVALRALRRQVMAANGWSLRDLYRTLDLPGQNPLRDAHARLDAAVREAYSMKPQADPLASLLALNHAVAEREARGDPVTAPGLPPCVTDPTAYVTEDCVRMPETAGR